MRRDEGKYFKVTEATKVCSRHFRPREIKKTLAGKNEPRAGVVPSVFEWIRTSPRKRKDPIAQNFEIPPSKAAHKLNFSSVDLTDDVLDNSANNDHLNGELFSNYKHRTTLKGLIGIRPGGAITFISQLYTGSISDREIVARSGFLDLPFEDNDSVMADKGFTIQDLLPMGVSFNIPPFLGSSSQMPAEDVVKIQETASLRIHVECAINKIQNFHIWDGVIPLHQLGLANQMRSVCAILCNVQPNIISI